MTVLIGSAEGKGGPKPDPANWFEFIEDIIHNRARLEGVLIATLALQNFRFFVCKEWLNENKKSMRPVDLKKITNKYSLFIEKSFSIQWTGLK